MSKREQAKLAEQAERYEDMVEYMKDAIKEEDVTDHEVRNLLSVAYKNVVGSRRSSWRVLNGIAEAPKNSDKVEITKKYVDVIEKELVDICEDVLRLLGDGTSDGLIKKTEDNPEATVFYCKMRGDYYRYLSEVKVGPIDGVHKDGFDTVSENANKAYEEASKKSETDLAPTHPIRLGLALNYSVFHYEIMRDTDKACKLAKHAFDCAISELDQLKDETYKDSTLIMQLLRDNLTLWTNEDRDKDDMEGKDE